MTDLGDAERHDTASHMPEAEPEATLGYLINLSARLLAQSLRLRNGPDGILPGQFPIVLELLRDDALTQRELCARVRIEQGTMANTLKRMERDAIIERHPHADDRRQHTIHLTAKGRRLAGQAMRNAHAVNAVALSGLDDAAQARLRQMLLNMTRALEQDIAGRGGSEQ